jgi:hypothetical protein
MTMTIAMARKIAWAWLLEACLVGDKARARTISDMIDVLDGVES